MPTEPSTARPLTSPLVPDLERVRQFILEMIAKGALLALVEAILGLLARMRDLNTELVQKLAQHRRAKPPNEKLARLQQELPFLREGAANDVTEPAGDEKTRSKKNDNKTVNRNRHKHARPKLPEHLPRVPELHRVPDDQRICPNCHVEIETIGHKCCEKLDVEPAKYVVKAIQREVGACPECHLYVRTAPRGDEVLDRGILGNELLVQSLVSHYADATPFERIARNAQREGVPLAANTLASSVGRVIDLLDPVVRHITQKTFSSEYAALDATAMPVLDDEHPLGIRSGSLWLIEGDGRWATFVYAPSGHAVHLEAVLKGYQLSLVMCDGSATINCVERMGARRGGCWSHGRRRLVEALRLGDRRALEGLQLIAEVFRVDAESKKAGETVQQRHARRQLESAPQIGKLRAWVKDRLGDVEPKSVLGKAVRYLDNQWPRLIRFLQEARMELTNNEVERDLRAWVLDRRTWFFVGHDDSARRTADALTILTTCRKFGIDPVRYIRDTLRKILDGEKSLAALLPENYVPSG